MPYKLSATLTLKDGFTQTAKRASKAGKDLTSSLHATGNAADKARVALNGIKPNPMGMVRYKKAVTDVGKALEKTTGKKYAIHMDVRDRGAKAALERLKSKARHMPVIRQSVDFKQLLTARRELRALGREMSRITGKKHTIKIKAEKDKSLSNVGKGGLFAGAGAMVAGGIMAGGAAAIGGTTALLQQGAQLQGYNTSMLHWTGGDVKKRDDYMKALRTEANATPFGTSDVVQAGSRALSITGGDTKKGMELVKMSEDMAALMPGKSPIDAMEALADALHKKIKPLIGHLLLIVMDAVYKTIKKQKSLKKLER